MPGIYGYVKKNKDDNQLSKMTKYLYHHKHFIKDSDFTDDNLQSSHLHLGNMKKNADLFFVDGIYISIEGEQYDYKEELFEKLLFNAYKKGVLEQFLNKLDGYFNAIIYDSNIKKIFLISDRYGMRMLYYYFQDGRFAFSGEVKGLLGLDFLDYKQIDSKQIDCFMDLGYLIEDNTLHKNIKLIKPATLMEFNINSKELSQKYYWKWSEIKPKDISFNEAVNKIGDIFIKSVEKRFKPDGSVNISLSGGLDSRAILAAVNKLYPDYKGCAFTFGTPNCDDILIAKQCVSKTSWEHKELYFKNDNWFEARKEKVWGTDGMFNMMHMHGSEFLENLSNKMEFVLNGYAGDVVLGGGWFSFLPLDTRAMSIYLRSFYKSWINECNINDSFYDIEHCEPHLYMNRVRRFTNMGIVNALTNLDQRIPFFDNKVIEFVYSLPDKYRKNNKLYSAMLLKFFPELFKNIPWQRTGMTIDKNSLFFKILSKARKIPYKFGILPNSSSYVNYKDWIKDDIISKNLKSLLDKNNAEYSKYTNIDFKNKYLIPHLTSNKNFSEQILRATTIELYLKRISSLSD